MVNYTTQNAQKLTILISKTQNPPHAPHPSAPSAPRNLAPSALDFRSPQVLPPSYAYGFPHDNT